jgi:hypothetical protein
MQRLRPGYSTPLDCVFQACGIIPRTRIAFSKPAELFRAPGLRFPRLRDYSAHFVCTFLACGIIPGTLLMPSWSIHLIRQSAKRHYPGKFQYKGGASDFYSDDASIEALLPGRDYSRTKFTHQMSATCRFGVR